MTSLRGSAAIAGSEERRHGAGSIARKRMFAVVTVLLAVVSTLAVCEAAARLWSKGPTVLTLGRNVRMAADPLLGYELVPGSLWEDDERGPIEGDTPINSAGLRDREYAETKPADSFRIAMVGDSVVFGEGVRARDTMAKVLERLLNDTRMGLATRYEVLDFGVSGYNSDQIARQVETLVSQFSPDLLAYVYCLNDPEDRDRDIEEALVALGPGNETVLQSIERRGKALLIRSRLYQLLMEVRDSFAGDHPKRLPVVPDDGAPSYYASLHADGRRWNRTQRDVMRMGSTARRLGARFVGVLSPHLWTGNDARRFRVDPPLSDVSAKVTSAFRAAGATVLDLAPAEAVYSRATGVFLGIDSVHYREVGHRFVAVAMLDFLMRQSLIPGTGARTAQSLPFEDPELHLMIQSLR